MPRFVILEHDHPHLHWDFMLECGAALKTWRLAALPLPGQAVRAEALGDHRLLYLDYEGPVSGNRGRVQRWDAGQFEWTTLPPEQAQEYRIQLWGKRIEGIVVLSAGNDGQWWFHFTAGS